MSDLWLSRAECERRAEAVGLGPYTLRAAIERGELPARKVGRAIKVRVSDLDAWLAAPGGDAVQWPREMEDYVCRVR